MIIITGLLWLCPFVFPNRTSAAHWLTWRAERAWLAGSFGFFGFIVQYLPEQKRGLSSRSEGEKSRERVGFSFQATIECGTIVIMNIINDE